MILPNSKSMIKNAWSIQNRTKWKSLIREDVKPVISCYLPSLLWLYNVKHFIVLSQVSIVYYCISIYLTIVDDSTYSKLMSNFC